MDINFRGMGTNYIFVDMYIWGSLTMANTYTHGYKYSLNSYSRGLIQSSKSMKIDKPRMIINKQFIICLINRTFIFSDARPTIWLCWSVNDKAVSWERENGGTWGILHGM